MQITLQDIGKKYSSANWIFRGVDLDIMSGERLALTGNNGSGKSTLLQIIGGSLQASRGQIQYLNSHGKIVSPAVDTFSYCAPYLELVNDFTVKEQVEFHFKFRKLKGCNDLGELLDVINLTGHEYKFVKNLSSGMRQRLKLGLAFYAACDAILLDEPTTNLDEKGFEWYDQQLNLIEKKITIIIASNQKYEYQRCEKIFNLSQAFDQ